MTSQPRLSVQLHWAARGLQAVTQGISSTEWLNRCPAELRPGVQAILLTALRHWGLGRALRQLLVPKAPAPAVDALRVLLADHVSQGGMVLFTSHQPVSLTSSAGQEVPMLRHRLQVPTSLSREAA